MQEAAGASEKELMVVTFTVTDPNTFALKADTPYADIREAANAGKIVYAFVKNSSQLLFGQLTNSVASELVFNAFSGETQVMNIIMKSDSDIHGTAETLLSRPANVVGGGDFDAYGHKIIILGEPTNDSDAATKRYADKILTAGNSDSVVLKSSTPNSTKKFRITVDDAGAITATEVV